MSPMGTVSAKEDGKATDWHTLHYGARALGQVGLVMLEVHAVTPQGKDSGSLGLWSDEHITPLQKVVQAIHDQGSKAGLQLWHVGRKGSLPQETAVSASGLPHRERATHALSIEEIHNLVLAFKEAAKRASQAGIDVIELHASHGYLINDFLSKYTNQREDAYGGSEERRYQFLREIIDEIRLVWSGPLFVRISADEYSPLGNGLQDSIQYAHYMKAQGVDLIDVSTGGVLPDVPSVYPGYQVPYSEAIRQAADIPTAAVGLITHGIQAEEILRNGRADLVAVGRELLRNPFWPRQAAEQLGVRMEGPAPYNQFWF